MILWEKYSEDELRTIVKLYYTNNGFCVDDLHESDKRGERGADLMVYKSGEAERTAIALKVRDIKNIFTHKHHLQIFILKWNNIKTKWIFGTLGN